MDDVLRRMNRRLTSAVRGDLPDMLTAEPTPRISRPPVSPVDPTIVNRLQSYPDEKERRPLVERLKALSPLAMVMLKTHADDEVRSRQMGVDVDLCRSIAKARVSDELIEHGLIEPTGECATLRLTKSGRELARLLKGLGEPPAYLSEASLK